MTASSTIDDNSQSTNLLLKIVAIFLILLVVIIGISVSWGYYQQQTAAQYVQDTIKKAFPTIPPFPTHATQNPTLQPTITPIVPKILIGTTYVVMNGKTVYRIPLVARLRDSSTSVTFTTENILLNGRSSNYYGAFAPQLYSAPALMTPILVSQLTLDQNGGGNSFEIKLLRGEGSPWIPGMTVTIIIQTITAQGSITVTLPSP
jgi:hypothetical protein